MTQENKERLKSALENAAEMIRGHAENGLFPQDVGEISEKGLNEYVKACNRAYKQILNLAKKYETK